MRENIFPEGVEAELPLQESARLPLRFLFGSVGFKGVFTKDCNAEVSSRDIAAPSLSRMHRSESPMGLMLRKPGGVAGAPSAADGQDGVLTAGQAG